MGRQKDSYKSSIETGKNQMSEIKETSERMNREAEDIDKLIKEIKVSDDDDQRAVADTNSGYKGSFDSASNTQIEKPGQDVEKTSERISDESKIEASNVETGIRNLEQAESISEIGKNAASSGKSKLDSSKQEYDNIVIEADGLSEKTKELINNHRNKMSGLFG